MASARRLLDRASSKIALFCASDQLRRRTWPLINMPWAMEHSYDHS